MTTERRLVKQPSTVSLFRMSAVMWNAHRVHFDLAYATEVEGHPGLLVPANLLSSYLCELLMSWAGPTTRLVRLSFQNRAPVYAGTTVTAWGREVTRAPADGADVVDLEIGIDRDGVPAVTGTARVLLPRAAPAAG